MSQLVLARGEAYKKNFLSRFFRNFQLGPYFLLSSLVLFVVLVTVITLMFSTRQVTKGYVLNKLEGEHRELIKLREEQNMRISQAKSLGNIQNSSRVKSMHKPDMVVFVEGETAIASR